MPDSPFVDPAMIEGAAIPEAPDFTRQWRDALLGVAGGALTFLPLGKLLNLGSPVKRALTGAGVGAGVVAAGDAMAQGKAGDVFPSPMHEIQARLAKAGIYRGPVDGISVPGGPTEKALDRLRTMFGEGDPLHILRMQQDPAYKESEEAKAAEKGKREAEKARSELGLAETKRKADLDKEVKEAAQKGESWGGMAKRWAPYIIGGALGGVAGGSVGWKYNKAAKKTAADAEAFASKHFAPKAAVTADNVADQAAAVNTFYERGKGQAPFTKITTSGELSPKSMSYQVSDQMPAGDLFKVAPKERAGALAKDAAAGGFAAGDYFLSSHYADKNKAQADEARNRFKTTNAAQDAVEATHAQGRSDMWNAATNAALPFASLYFGMRYKGLPMKSKQPGMEAMQGADATRLKVQDYLNRQPSGGPQSVLAHKPGGASAPIHGGQLKALPAPTAPSGIGPHTSAQARAAIAERRANTEKILSGSMAQRSHAIMQEHTNAFAKVDATGKLVLTTRSVKQLERKLQEEHGMVLSNWLIKKKLREAGVTVKGS